MRLATLALFFLTWQILSIKLPNHSRIGITLYLAFDNPRSKFLHCLQRRCVHEGNGRYNKAIKVRINGLIYRLLLFQSQIKLYSHESIQRMNFELPQREILNIGLSCLSKLKSYFLLIKRFQNRNSLFNVQFNSLQTDLRTVNNFNLNKKYIFFVNNSVRSTILSEIELIFF